MPSHPGLTTSRSRSPQAFIHFRPKETRALPNTTATPDVLRSSRQTPLKRLRRALFSRGTIPASSRTAESYGTTTQAPRPALANSTKTISPHSQNDSNNGIHHTSPTPTPASVENQTPFPSTPLSNSPGPCTAAPTGWSTPDTHFHRLNVEEQTNASPGLFSTSGPETGNIPQGCGCPCYQHGVRPTITRNVNMTRGTQTNFNFCPHITNQTHLSPATPALHNCCNPSTSGIQYTTHAYFQPHQTLPQYPLDPSCTTMKGPYPPLHPCVQVSFAPTNTISNDPFVSHHVMEQPHVNTSIQAAPMPPPNATNVVPGTCFAAQRPPSPFHAHNQASLSHSCTALCKVPGSQPVTDRPETSTFAQAPLAPSYNAVHATPGSHYGANEPFCAAMPDNALREPSCPATGNVPESIFATKRPVPHANTFTNPPLASSQIPTSAALNSEVMASRPRTDPCEPIHSVPSRVPLNKVEDTRFPAGEIAHHASPSRNGPHKHVRTQINHDSGGCPDSETPLQSQGTISQSFQMSVSPSMKPMHLYETQSREGKTIPSSNVVSPAQSQVDTHSMPTTQNAQMVTPNQMGGANTESVPSASKNEWNECSEVTDGAKFIPIKGDIPEHGWIKQQMPQSRLRVENPPKLCLDSLNLDSFEKNGTVFEQAVRLRDRGRRIQITPVSDEFQSELDENDVPAAFMPGERDLDELYAVSPMCRMIQHVHELRTNQSGERRSESFEVATAKGQRTVFSAGSPTTPFRRGTSILDRYGHEDETTSFSLCSCENRTWCQFGTTETQPWRVEGRPRVVYVRPCEDMMSMRNGCSMRCWRNRERRALHSSEMRTCRFCNGVK